MSGKSAVPTLNRSSTGQIQQTSEFEICDTASNPFTNVCKRPKVCLFDDSYIADTLHVVEFDTGIWFD